MDQFYAKALQLIDRIDNGEVMNIDKEMFPVCDNPEFVPTWQLAAAQVLAWELQLRLHTKLGQVNGMRASHIAIKEWQDTLHNAIVLAEPIPTDIIEYCNSLDEFVF